MAAGIFPTGAELLINAILAVTTQAIASSPTVIDIAQKTVDTSPNVSYVSTIANMIGGLLVVISLIFVLAYIVKRLNIMPNHHGVIKTVAVTSLGQREKLMVVELNGQQYFIGVTGQQISVLDKLEQPVVVDSTTFANKLKRAKEQQ
ncbi:MULTISPECIES: flagellar biosynthetic protein FliO [Shewanella]|nr:MULTISPECIES: flagellar biosynthetic protein FliO [Shewanella]